MENLNSNLGGYCTWPTYDPPHCIGYENGEVREGFNIPCGRGHDVAVTFWTVCFFGCYFIAPIIVGVSLGIMYRTALKQERQMRRYGVTESQPK